jgi:hypothetical protein
MTEPRDSKQFQSVSPGDKAAPAQPPSAPAETSAKPSQLTPEEQMALFEKDLKENDWGHQPC